MTAMNSHLQISETAKPVGVMLAAWNTLGSDARYGNTPTALVARYAG
jgi:hypothetical protein